MGWELVVGDDDGTSVGEVLILGVEVGTLVVGASVGIPVGFTETLGDSDATRVGLSLGVPLGEADGDVDILG